MGQFIFSDYFSPHSLNIESSIFSYDRWRHLYQPYFPCFFCCCFCGCCLCGCCSVVLGVVLAVVVLLLCGFVVIVVVNEEEKKKKK